ncbi:MacB-like core domain-containing protein [Mariniphaga anaerophila]|uniref:MacB-like core domain-containing protein n=1 Tax=Mariniphaga anaerophila TaxID=1484053 RepID=A0A1M5DQV1_9BACT|nr:ABC transporter permease [Mariniphaga anaerophila]SHF69231.1 MacB-like core domain-containing protein [Mariniphaga anaerophila]
MTKFGYIFKSFCYFLKANLLVAFGVAISAMVLTGSLIIGDSVRYSLEQSAFYRLGETTHLVAVTERYFRQEMASEIEADNPDIEAAPVLLLEGVAVAGGGQQRANRVQVVGVDESFEKIARSEVFSTLQDNEIIISKNLAERLDVVAGDNILVRIKKASLIPLNAPFVSGDEISVSLRAVIKKVVEREEMGRFSLRNSQTAPYNIFLSIERLNRLMEFEGKANHLLVATHLGTNAVLKSVKNCLTPADAGLKIRTIEATGELEISTERVFMEPKVAETLGKLPAAKPLITYFVNGIVRADSVAGTPQIPYSFVSSLGDKQLADNEIILTKWAADDLGVSPGDSIKLKYFEIGPLRKLINCEAGFILKEIVPMNEIWADSTRMPWLPGLSDAGHCREWDAGVPIDLDAIRDKDEKYWNEWRGAPKAYVSLNRALEIWKNRFGSYTAVRYPAATFDMENFRQVFSENVLPSDLGMTVEPIREQGVSAARNGTDFSGLFLGLSFFILVSAIILTVLLFRLNLETRSAEVGVLAALGFKERQVRSIFLLEGLVVALAGGLLGLVFSVLYTSAVFRILNTLWFDIVRTDVLLIKIFPTTLVAGLIISLVVSLGAIYVSIVRYQRRKTAELQKRTESGLKKGWSRALDVAMWISLVVPLVLVLLQLLHPGALDAMLFFLSGGLLLLGFLLGFRKILLKLDRRKTDEIRLSTLSVLNLARNKGRSLTVVILFALGTFLVISTGSNKLDLFANAQDKSSGTGGFLYFAETTMPVLYNLNDREKRAEEGIYEDFTAVQFRKVQGDDASCLNLNRIAQPAILGVDPQKLEGRFSFAALMDGFNSADPWLDLNAPLDDGAIPAIADQTVIQWGLGKKVGDELLYQNEQGDTLRLKLIAGTTPSVFQGYVIISNKHFLENYPTNSGSYIFLIDGSQEKESQIGEELQSVFRDYGWQMEPTAKRLVEFFSVTNTYLSIFLALGALGMILGTIGLAIILARTILERRREIALMQAVGFNTGQLFRLLATEYLMLLVAGVLSGFVTAVVATLPSFVSSNTDASLGTVAIIVALILANGVAWIAGLSWLSLRKKKLALGVREE